MVVRVSGVSVGIHARQGVVGGAGLQNCRVELLDSVCDLNCLQSWHMLCPGRANDLNGSMRQNGERCPPHQYNFMGMQRGNTYRGHVALMDSAYREEWKFASVLDVTGTTPSGLGAADWENMVGPGKDVYASSHIVVGEKGKLPMQRSVPLCDGWWHEKHVGNFATLQSLFGNCDLKAPRYVLMCVRATVSHGEENGWYAARTSMLFDSKMRMKCLIAMGGEMVKKDWRSHERLGSEESKTEGEDGMVRASRGVDNVHVAGMPDGVAPCFEVVCSVGAVVVWEGGTFHHVVQMPLNVLDGCVARAVRHCSLKWFRTDPLYVPSSLQESLSWWMLEGSCSACWLVCESVVSCEGVVALPVSPDGESVETDAVRMAVLDGCSVSDSCGALSAHDVVKGMSMAVGWMPDRLSDCGWSVPKVPSDCAGSETPLVDGSCAVVALEVRFKLLRWLSVAMVCMGAMEVLPRVTCSCLTRMLCVAKLLVFAAPDDPECVDRGVRLAMGMVPGKGFAMNISLCQVWAGGPRGCLPTILHYGGDGVMGMSILVVPMAMKFHANPSTGGGCVFGCVESQSSADGKAACVQMGRNELVDGFGTGEISYFVLPDACVPWGCMVCSCAADMVWEGRGYANADVTMPDDVLFVLFAFVYMCMPAVVKFHASPLTRNRGFGSSW